MYLLVTIVLCVRVCLGEPGAGALSAGSPSATYGFGLGGGIGLGYDNGFGSRYGYTPQSLFSDGGFSSAYGPGRINSFIPFAHRSLTPLGPQNIGSYSTTSYRNPNIPEPYFYRRYQSYVNPDYPNFTPETPVPVTPSVPYYRIPYFESVETYKFYNPSEALNEIKTQSVLKLDSRTEINTSNKTSNGSSVADNIEESQKKDTTSEAEPVLQLSYLGYVPHSEFRSASQRIPFYYLDYDDVPSGSPRSSSGSPNMYVSPTRLLPRSGVYSDYPKNDIGYTGSFVSPITSTSASIPVVSPYRSASSYSTLPDDYPGYYFDVNPLGRDSARLSSGPILGAPRPTIPIPPFIQTLTGPMGGPMSGLLRPMSTGQNSNAQSQTGIYNGGENVNKFENQNFNAGFETQLPNGHAYSNFQANKEVSAQKYDERGEKGFNTGYGSQNFHTPGFEDILVRYLIAV